MRCRLLRPFEGPKSGAAGETALTPAQRGAAGPRQPASIGPEDTRPTQQRNTDHRLTEISSASHRTGTLASVLVPGRRACSRRLARKSSGSFADVATEPNATNSSVEIDKKSTCIPVYSGVALDGDGSPSATDVAAVMSGDGDCGSLHGLRGSARECSAISHLISPIYSKHPVVSAVCAMSGQYTAGTRRGHCRTDDDCLLYEERTRPAVSVHNKLDTRDILSSLPVELALAVITNLSPLDVASLSATCRSLAAITRHARAGSGQVLRMLPRQRESSELQPPTALLDSSCFPTLVKNSRPGFGTFVGAEPANAYNTLFELRVERLAGVNLEVGLAPASAFSGGGLHKSRAWLFDCWGRKSHRGTSSAYGAKLRPGDRLGVLFNHAAKSLTFLHNDISMGTAFTGVKTQQPLFPVISMPFLPGEAVTLLEPSRACRDLLPLEATHAHWVCPPHPDDDKLVVETMWYSSFRLALDMSALTVRRLKEVMAGITAYDKENLCVIVDGKHCADDKHLAADCKVHFGLNHTHVPHVLLSIVHAMS